MVKINPDQLADVIKLLQKYSKKDWDDIFEFLNSKEEYENLIMMVQSLQGLRSDRTLSHSVSNQRELSPPEKPITKVLSEVREESEEKHTILKAFRDSVKGRQILPSLESLRMFANDCGLKNISTRSKRETVLNNLIRHLADVDLDRLKNLLEQIQMGDEDYGNEYERWVKLILGDSTTR